MENIEMPEVVTFDSGGQECKAFVVFGQTFGLNMRVCQLMFEEAPSVAIEYIPGAARVRLNNGLVWFDTDGDSAAAIEALFQTGKAPYPHNKR
ncbi:hypothetical protein EZI54_07115 [Marinobacter halodurans]|uniref:DUF2442 domain-containing protein n=1 Tax=Marinobacter halodurans TaxID=2528979 RepID=A0ABY1ZMM6_9GAMM|nr:hypothetical protein [Marinobacter halodurans]TBW57421.1 hypothetical protein EZI54_07115 [Marinobacter halodurans]